MWECNMSIFLYFQNQTYYYYGYVRTTLLLFSKGMSKWKETLEKTVTPNLTFFSRLVETVWNRIII